MDAEAEQHLLGAIGQAKLEHAKLWPYFSLGGWSDGYETRADVFRGALAKMRSHIGEAAAICIVGDTPSDIAAAHANKLPIIAVATGIYTPLQLQEEQPDLLVQTLEELL